MISTVYNAHDRLGVDVRTPDHEGKEKSILPQTSEGSITSMFDSTHRNNLMSPVYQTDLCRFSVANICGADAMPRLSVMELPDGQIAVRIGDCEVHIMPDIDKLLVSSRSARTDS